MLAFLRMKRKVHVWKLGLWKVPTRSEAISRLAMFTVAYACSNKKIGFKDIEKDTV